jgi:hypothetical protein
VDVKVTLLMGKIATFAGVKADQSLDLNLKTSQSTQVKKEGNHEARQQPTHPS